MEEKTKNKILVSFLNQLEKKWLNPVLAFKAADENSDRSVSAEEFSNFFSALGVSGWLQEHEKDLFKIIDTTNDGTVSFQEFNDAVLRAANLQGLPEFSEAPLVEVDENTKYVALVSHNEMRNILINFVGDYKEFFNSVPLVTTESTGQALKQSVGVPVEKFVASASLGGYQAVGGMMSEGNISAIFFFKDPLSSANSADIEALARLCDVHQIPYATNPASAVGILMALKEFGMDWKMESKEPVIEKYKLW